MLSFTMETSLRSYSVTRLSIVLPRRSSVVPFFRARSNFNISRAISLAFFLSNENSFCNWTRVKISCTLVKGKEIHRILDKHSSNSFYIFPHHPGQLCRNYENLESYLRLNYHHFCDHSVVPLVYDPKLLKAFEIYRSLNHQIAERDCYDANYRKRIYKNHHKDSLWYPTLN
uniref:Uncharacterized protein n=1 Tax=Glossina pallidipes TaxID=7398 RepID=A0A1B0A8Y1_GLOPL